MRGQAKGSRGVSSLRWVFFSRENLRCRALTFVFLFARGASLNIAVGGSLARPLFAFSFSRVHCCVSTAHRSIARGGKQERPVLDGRASTIALGAYAVT